MDISGKVHSIRLRFDDRGINPQTVGLFMKKGGEEKETFMPEPEALASFCNTSFSEDEAGLTAKH